MNDNTPLTPQEVADMLKISNSTVYELIKQNKINSYKVGKKLRVDLKDVEAYKNKTKSMDIEESRAVNMNNLFSGVVDSTVSYSTETIKSDATQSPFVICGQDMLLDVLSRYLQMPPNGIPNLRLYQGCYNSLSLLYKGEANVAVSHIWDEETGTYNTSYVSKILPATSCILVNLAYRWQGYYVKSGNPKNIQSWDDLKRTDIVFMNREKGSGTRILLDEKLRVMDVDKNRVPGYKKEGSSHIAVASAVSRGEADYGLGIENAVNQVNAIDFIPLQKEQYDLVIKKEDMNNPIIQRILFILSSKEFRNEISTLGCYDISDLGKLVGEV